MRAEGTARTEAQEGRVGKNQQVRGLSKGRGGERPPQERSSRCPMPLQEHCPPLWVRVLSAENVPQAAVWRRDEMGASSGVGEGARVKDPANT